jgi:signal transduction histidine kinase
MRKQLEPGQIGPLEIVEAQRQEVAARAWQLDLVAVVKASQTISSEIVKEKLIRTLLQVVLEQGGAERAYFLHPRGASISIEAEATRDEHGVHTRLLGPVPAESAGLVPSSMVDYVHRTKERLMLDDAATMAGSFSSDEYIARMRPKSILCLPILREAEMFGLVYLENNLVAGAFTTERLIAMDLLASQAAISLENALLLAKAQTARQAAEQHERRLAFCAEASESLSESLEYDQVLWRLAKLCVRHLGDCCVIDVIDHGEIRRVAGVHANPAKQQVLEELQRRYPPQPGSSHPMSQVMRTGQPLLIPELTDAELRRICVDEDHMRIVREIGALTAMCVPFVARGQIIGGITLVSAKPVCPYGTLDLEMAQELAHRGAIAIDNARLYREAQQAIRQRDEFLAVASHELRTPVTSLGLALEAIIRTDSSRKPLDPEALEQRVQRAVRQGKRLNKLIEDLLEVSRIETTELPLDPTEVELESLVHEVVEGMDTDLLRFRCPVSIRAGARVRGRWDRSRLDQVVTNLLTNAIKFGAGKPIDIAIDQNAGVARLRVEDHGIGIDPAEQKHIFERFGRAVSARHYAGLGLGLYICRRIVEAHGGSIRVESQPGAGAAFTVELPVRDPP